MTDFIEFTESIETFANTVTAVLPTIAIIVAVLGFIATACFTMIRVAK